MNKRFVLNSLLVVLAAWSFELTGCKRSNESGEGPGAAILVGEYASLTGKEAAFGQSSHKGTLLAVDEINAAGGVLSKPIRLVYEDNQTKPGESATIVKKLITRDQVVAVLGEVATGRSLEAAPICQTHRIPMISPSSTNPQVTETGDYIFRVCFTDPFQGKLLAEFAHRFLKAKRVAIVTDVATPYSVGLAQYFREPFTAAGGTVVAEQRFSAGDKDFKAQLTSIKASNPEAIFVPSYYTEAGLIVFQARQLGINVPLFGGDGWEAPELIQIGGAALEGCYYSTHYSPEDKSPLVQNFVQKFKAKYSETPDAMAALGYDSVLMLVEGMRRAGTTAEPQLRDALAATKDLEGVTGKTTMDAQRNATKSAVIITIKEGKFHLVEKIAP